MEEKETEMNWQKSIHQSMNRDKKTIDDEWNFGTPKQSNVDLKHEVGLDWPKSSNSQKSLGVTPKEGSSINRKIIRTSHESEEDVEEDFQEYRLHSKTGLNHNYEDEIEFNIKPVTSDLSVNLHVKNKASVAPLITKLTEGEDNKYSEPSQHKYPDEDQLSLYRPEIDIVDPRSHTKVEHFEQDEFEDSDSDSIEVNVKNPGQVQNQLGLVDYDARYLELTPSALWNCIYEEQ